MRETLLRIGSRHLAELEEIVPVLQAQHGGSLPRVPTFQHLATALSEDGEYERARSAGRQFPTVSRMGRRRVSRDGSSGSRRRRRRAPDSELPLGSASAACRRTPIDSSDRLHSSTVGHLRRSETGQPHRVAIIFPLRRPLYQEGPRNTRDSRWRRRGRAGILTQTGARVLR
jgi:hypothetical protein